MNQETIDFLNELKQLCVKYKAQLDGGGRWESCTSVTINGQITDYIEVDENGILTADGKTLDELNQV